MDRYVFLYRRSNHIQKRNFNETQSDPEKKLKQKLQQQKKSLNHRNKTMAAAELKKYRQKNN